MGSMISLGVGRMEIDWGKNHIFRDHSAIFKPEDVKPIPYYYVDDDGAPIVKYKEGYSRKLASIKQRLDLLGYTLGNVQRMYNQVLDECAEHGLSVTLSFDAFFELLKDIDISRINTLEYAVEYDENGYDLGEFARRCIIPDKEIYSRLLVAFGGDKHELNYELETFFENLNPYVILRLLAENPGGRNLDVFWSFADVVENGWAKREEIVKPLSCVEKILIVTEGSSDSFIIRRVFELLYTDISDFFRFIDMQEGYPFTGVGNLYNFCCGLMKIGISNKIIIIFDNDTVGKEKFEKLKKMPQMGNLLITKLPDSSLFSRVKTLGPQGISVEDINGSAVAIECFLDFASCERSPVIRWVNYMEKSQKYQGALMYKDDFVRVFKKADLLTGTYDSSKLRMLIDYLLEQWCNYWVFG